MVLPALALVLNSAYAAVSAEELLEPERAFRISTRALDESNVEVRFDIADGYYMYRDRFKFETQSGKVLADADIPRGVRKKDEFFGETETHRRAVMIRVPVQADAIEGGRIRLKVTSQGCSDQGVCYTPLEQRVEVTQPGTSATRSWNAPWAYVSLGIGALMLFALSYQLAPRLIRSRTIAAMGRRPYLVLGIAFAALVAWSVIPLLTQQLRDFVVGALLIIAAMWLRALDPLPQPTSGTHRFGKGIGVLALVAGIIFIVFAAGGRDLLMAKREPRAVAPPAKEPHLNRVSEALVPAIVKPVDNGRNT